MFWNKPKIGSFRIAKKFVPDTNQFVFEVQKYSSECSYDDLVETWVPKQVCTDMDTAVMWIERYKKADNVVYYYL